MFSRLADWWTEHVEKKPPAAQKLLVGLITALIVSVVGLLLKVMWDRWGAEQPFRVYLEASIVAPRCGQTAGFWVLRGEGEETVRIPANAALFLRIINTQGVEATLDHLSVDAMHADGTWQTLHRVRTDLWPVYFNDPDYKQPRRISDDTAFVDKLASKAPLRAAGGDVRGWVLVQYPAGFEIPQTPTVRVTVADVLGHSSTSKDLVSKALGELRRNPYLRFADQSFYDLSPFPIEGPYREWVVACSWKPMM